MSDITNKETNNPIDKGSVEIKTTIANLSYNISIFLLFIVLFASGYSLLKKIVNSNEGSNIETAKPSAIVQVEILNGSGIGGLANRAADYLRGKGIDVVRYGNYDKGIIEKTLAINRSENLANAKLVAKLLGIKNSNIIEIQNPDLVIDVTIIIGLDYQELEPFK